MEQFRKLTIDLGSADVRVGGVDLKGHARITIALDDETLARLLAPARVAETSIPVEILPTKPATVASVEPTTNSIIAGRPELTDGAVRHIVLNNTRVKAAKLLGVSTFKVQALIKQLDLPVRRAAKTTIGPQGAVGADGIYQLQPMKPHNKAQHSLVVKHRIGKISRHLAQFGTDDDVRTIILAAKNIGEAAETLGIGHSTIYSVMRKLGISRGAAA